MIQTQSRSDRYVTTVSNARRELEADALVNRGGGAGFGAHELLEAALAVCINMAVRTHAHQQAIPLESAEFRAAPSAT